MIVNENVQILKVVLQEKYVTFYYFILKMHCVLKIKTCADELKLCDKQFRIL